MKEILLTKINKNNIFREKKGYGLEEDNIIFAEIEITLENKEIVKVLDKIEFDTNLKIISITAFKG